MIAFIEKYEEKCQNEEKLPDGEKYASVEQVEGETIIVIVDPFMRRVHKYVPQSGDLLLMDATSNLDRSDTKLFHLMTPAAVGALPLGTIITSREDEKTILKGLQMMKKILPTYAFYGRGPNLGPVLGLTDDSDAERNALRIAWPLIQLLLCFFHVLQAHWQFIFKSESKIEKKDKPALLRMMREIMYCETQDDFDDAVDKMKESQEYNKYENYKKYMEDKVMPRNKEWSLLHRITSQLPTNNVNVTNYVETSFRVTKELKFNRHRAHNLVEMVR